MAVLRKARWRVAALVAAGVAACMPPDSFAQGLEYEVKAAFLYNFVQLTTWPAHAFAVADEPLRVCVAGTDPFGAHLDRSLEGQRVGARPMRVERLGPAERAAAAATAPCHVLFVATDAAPLTSALAHAHGYALLVGESPEFLLRGGIINFIVDAGRVRFDVNTAAAAARGLKLSARLLRVARVASDPGQQQ